MADRFWVGGTANFDGTAGTKWATTSGGAGGASVPGATDRAIFDANSGAVTVTVGASRNPLDIICTGFTGTLAGSQAMTVSGGIIWGAGMTLTYTGVLTFNATGVTIGITSNGIAMSSTLTFNGVGGDWTFNDSMSTTSTVGLTNGALRFGGATATMSALGSANTNVRTLALGNCNIRLTGTGNVWNLGTITNLTFSTGGASKISVINATATAKSAQFNTLTYDDLEFTGAGSGAFSYGTGTTVFRDVLISNSGGGGFSFTSPSSFRNWDFTGYTGTWSGSSGVNIGGNLTTVAGMTITSTSTLTFNGTGTQVITSNGKTFGASFVLSHTGTVTLGDALSNTGVITHNTGLFDSNSKNMTVGGFLSQSGLTRSLTLGTSLVTCVNAGTSVWSVNTTALTSSVASSTILLNNATASSKTFAGGGLTYGTVQFGGAGSGVFIVANSSSFAAMQIIGQHTVQFTAGTGQDIADISGLSGTPGVLNSLQSTSAGTIATLTKAGNDNFLDYCNLKDLKVAGGARWWAGVHSVDQGNNNGWRYAFAAPRGY